MLSQKVKEKLETEGVCNTVIISIRDDIEEQEADYLAVLRELKSLRSQLRVKNATINNYKISNEQLKKQL